MSERLEGLYQEARSALKAKDYSRASDLLRQILLIDENYRDASRLLAQAVRLRRRRWYNHPLLWGALGFGALVALGFFLAPRLRGLYASLPTAANEPINSPAAMLPQTIIPAATETSLPAPTTVPPVWKRVSMGQEFIRDTVTAIVVDPRDPDVIYVGMQNAGIFKSIDGGNSWGPSLQGLENAQVRALWIDPQAPDSLIAGTAGGVFKSIDGGSSWQWQADYRVQELLMDPQDSSHLYLGDGNGVFETKDGGNNWTMTLAAGGTCPSINGYSSLKMDPKDGRVLYATTSGQAESAGGCQGVYRSTDGGHSWTRLGLNSAEEMAILQDERGRTILMISGGMDGGGENSDGLFLSMDEGLNWRFAQSYRCSVMATSTGYTSNMYCGMETGGLYKTSSAGGVLASGLDSEKVTALYADSYNGQERIIAGVEKNGLYISTDGGKSWSNKFGGLGATYLSLTVGKADGTRLYANSQYADYRCVLYRSDDRGGGWELVTDTLSQKYNVRMSTCIPAIDSDDTLYAFPEMGLAKSYDGGETWEYMQIPPLDPREYTTRYVAANPYASAPIYFLTSDSRQLFFSFDSGKSWQAGTSSSDHRDPHLFFTGEGQVVYSGNSNGHMEISKDAGQTWQMCASNAPANANSNSYLAIDPRDHNRLFYATAGNGIELGVGCNSWATANIGITSRFFNTVAIDPSHPDILYAGSDGGAYVSRDGGQSWGEVNSGLLGATVVYSIVVDQDSNVYAATPYGIFKLEAK